MAFSCPTLFQWHREKYQPPTQNCTQPLRSATPLIIQQFTGVGPAPLPETVKMILSIERMDATTQSFCGKRLLVWMKSGEIQLLPTVSFDKEQVLNHPAYFRAWHLEQTRRRVQAYSADPANPFWSGLPLENYVPREEDRHILESGGKLPYCRLQGSLLKLITEEVWNQSRAKIPKVLL